MIRAGIGIRILLRLLLGLGYGYRAGIGVSLWLGLVLGLGYG